MGFATGRGKILLRLVFREHAGDHLLEAPLSEDQVANVLGNGELEVVATVPETSQLVWWLLAFEANVEVLAPGHLREEMRAAAGRVAALYG